jgi:hypothetical protein
MVGCGGDSRCGFTARLRRANHRVVIVWINGAFGAGKTTVASALVARLRGAILFDPEVVGVVLGGLLPNRRGDFQDLPSWRRWTVRLVETATRFRPHIVVPMTLVNRDYFQEVVGTLCARHRVQHFTLMTPADVLRDRLRARGSDGEWGERQIDRCMAALTASCFAEHIPTAGRAVDGIVTEIAASLGAFRARDDPSG